MRIIIAGSRNVTETEVRTALYRCSWLDFASVIVSGTAKGADMFGELWADERNLLIQRFPADWKKHGKRAGPLRNELMAKNAEGLVAGWNGKSRGTQSMIELASKLGLRITIVRTDTDSVQEFRPKGLLADIWEYAEERAALMEFDGGMSRSQAEREAGIEILRHFGETSN